MNLQVLLFQSVYYNFVPIINENFVANHIFILLFRNLSQVFILPLIDYACIVPFSPVLCFHLHCSVHTSTLFCSASIFTNWPKEFMIIICMCIYVYICAVLCLVAQSCLTHDPMDYSLPGSSVHGDSPGENIGVGCHALLQGIFLTQGWKLHLLHWQADSLPLHCLGSNISEMSH